MQALGKRLTRSITNPENFVDLMPSLFVSHGAPTFALEPGELGARLTQLGAVLPRTRAVLVLSPHWMSRGLLVTAGTALSTIHDFGGFDEALYTLQYPAVGAPAVAARTIELLGQAGWRASPEAHRGLDHGAWVPLRHLYPQADVPVIQVSMPADLEPDSAYALGAALAPLRAQGVLIVGSGSLTHNLYEIRRSANGAGAPYARQFADWARETVLAQDHARLLRTMELAPHAKRAHPTTEHLLPLMFAAGTAGPTAPATVLEGGVTYGVLAMDSYVFGPMSTPPSTEAQHPVELSPGRTS